MNQLEEVKEQTDALIADLKVLSAEVGEWEQTKAQRAKLKADAKKAEERLSAMRAEYADLDRRRAHAIAEHQAEHSRMVAAGAEELARLNAALDKMRGEVAEARAVLAERDALKQRLNGG